MPCVLTNPFSLSVLAVLALTADLRGTSVAPLFCDHAVLQRDRELPVWGSGAPGETITVKFAGLVATGQTGGDGRWKVQLPALSAASAGRDFSIEGATTLIIHDVCVGEVWLVSGQSNMAWKLSQDRDFLLERPRATTRVRQFYTQRTMSQAPQESVTGSWSSSDERGARDFSAVGWYFSQALARVLDVPVGIVNSTWGNTPIEAWLPPQSPTLNAQRVPKELYQRDSILYNAMIYPHAPFALRGAIWYQGESNVDEAALYKGQIINLITAWRRTFQQEGLSFYWVQLPRYAADDGGTNAWARLREAQGGALALPHTGQAIALDQGEVREIHPNHKREVGLRLARLALKRDYGIAVEDEGPLFRNAVFHRDGIVVNFQPSASPLDCPDARVTGFEVAAADRSFYPAVAQIVGENVIVTNPIKVAPAALRYGWHDAPACNLYNKVGLPCAPFRTDNW